MTFIALHIVPVVLNLATEIQSVTCSSLADAWIDDGIFSTIIFAASSLSASYASSLLSQAIFLCYWTTLLVLHLNWVMSSKIMFKMMEVEDIMVVICIIILFMVAIIVDVAMLGLPWPLLLLLVLPWIFHWAEILLCCCTNPGVKCYELGLDCIANSYFAKKWFIVLSLSRSIALQKIHTLINIITV